MPRDRYQGKRISMVFFLFWSLFEFVVFFNFVEAYGFIYSFLAYLLPSFLGLILLGRSGQVVFSQLQMQMQKGEPPAKTLLRTAAYYISGILFLIPSLLTRLLGVLLWVPFVRTLLVALLFKNMANSTSSRFRVFTAGSEEVFREPFQSEVHTSSIRDVTPSSIQKIETTRTHSEPYTEQTR